MASEQVKMAKLMRMLGSSESGEATAALSRLNTIMAKSGTDWNEVVSQLGWDGAIESWREIVDELLLWGGAEGKTFDFLKAMQKWRGEPSEKQMAWISSIWDAYKEEVG